MDLLLKHALFFQTDDSSRVHRVFLEEPYCEKINSVVIDIFNFRTTSLFWFSPISDAKEWIIMQIMITEGNWWVELTTCARPASKPQGLPRRPRARHFLFSAHFQGLMFLLELLGVATVGLKFPNNFISEVVKSLTQKSGCNFLRIKVHLTNLCLACTVLF